MRSVCLFVQRRRVVVVHREDGGIGSLLPELPTRRLDAPQDVRVSRHAATQFDDLRGLAKYSSDEEGEREPICAAFHEEANLHVTGTPPRTPLYQTSPSGASSCSGVSPISVSGRNLDPKSVRSTTITHSRSSRKESSK
jgi:hypothetical protein